MSDPDARPTPPPPFASQAPNAQDVVLLRAFGLGTPAAPVRCSETLAIKPGEAASAAPLLTALLAAGWQGPAAGAVLHVLSVHGAAAVAGALADAPARPWVLIVTDADRQSVPAVEGYSPVLFDGVSDVLVHDGFAGTRLAEALGHAACVRDAYTTAEQRERHADLARWRTRALDAWASRSIEAASGAAQQELADLRASTSWRLTKPIRTIGEKIPQRLRG